MRFKTICAALSAFALAGSLGVATAQQNPNADANQATQNSSANSDQANANTGASESISPAEQTRLAYSAAGLLRGQMVVDADQQIPQSIVQHARCIAVFPGVFKAGVIFAGSHGDGIVSCRDDGGDWNAPAYFNLSAGSVGLQAGAKVTQLLVLFMTPSAVNELMNGNFKFGGTIGVAAGPVGLHANVHTLPAATLAYKLDQTGAFAGAEIKGTTISADQSATSKIYGPNTSIKQVLFSRNQVPDRLQVFNEVLSMYAPAQQYARNELQVKQQSQTAK
ncbi:MAG TPA: lipid-binding SYLF domain-containing protein [Gammaproteobacteria bacterium]|nr:lipid-binding SYLF domain-containing protein [Gammaproteobacteria bacterium]